MGDVKVMFRWLFGVGFFIHIAANAKWVTNGSWEYFFGTKLVDYEEAKRLCSNMSGIKSQLVAIYTEEIQKFLQDIINNNLRGKVISNLIKD